MHDPTPQDAAAARAMIEWALARLADRRRTLPPLTPAPALPSLPERGLGSEAAMALLCDAVFPTASPADHPRYLAFVPGVPTVAAVLADMALSASQVFGGSRLEGGSALQAEDAVIRWLADAAGLPETAGGTFVSGGSIANLSALVAARGERYANGRRHVVITGVSAHASLAAAARIMGCDLCVAEPADDHGRLDGRTLTAALDGHDPQDVVAVVATSGATNNGAVDDLAAIADICSRHGIWLHVDGAYGGGALISSRTRPLFAGIERVDSLTVNPHKWLYLPFDCSAVIYRDKLIAGAALTQRADYLEALDSGMAGNPFDLAIHLTRRARGLPLWASLVANGTNAYVEAIETCLDRAAYAAAQIEAASHAELVIEPSLTVMLLRRLGWGPDEYTAWSEEALRSGLAFVMPTKHLGETVLRFCFVNPLTTTDDIDLVIASLA
jgi:glutamate/tyrosine decarboxylase-like PLP-dependent enzyme